MAPRRPTTHIEATPPETNCDTGTGIVIRDEYNVTLPNFLMHADRWYDGAGRPPNFVAVLVLMWMTDKVTKVVEGVGHVLHGSPIKFAVIAKNMGVSWRTVQSAVKYLVGRKLLGASRGSDMQEYSFSVPNCRKTFKTGKLDTGKYHKRERPKTFDIQDADDDLSPGTVEFIDEDDDAELS